MLMLLKLNSVCSLHANIGSTCAFPAPAEGSLTSVQIAFYPGTVDQNHTVGTNAEKALHRWLEQTLQTRRKIALIYRCQV